MKKVNVELLPYVGKKRQAGGYRTVEIFCSKIDMEDQSSAYPGDLLQPEIPCEKLKSISIEEESGLYCLYFRLRAKHNSEQFTEIRQFVRIQ